MDEGQRWTPGSAPALPEPVDGGQDWSAPPSRAFLGDPRWGIRADLPTTTPGRGMPAVGAPGREPAYASPTPVAPSPAPVYASPTPVAPSPAPAYASPTPVYASPTPAARPAAGPAPFAAPAFGAPAFGAPAFGASVPSRAGFGQPAFPGAGVPAPFAPVRAKNPGWVIALAVVLIGGFLTSVGAAVAIPVFLNSRVKAQTSELRTDLMTVAAAEEAVHARGGTYSADPDTVTGQLGAAITSRVSIMWADQSGFCAQAVPAGRTTPQLYYSSAAGISQQSCG